MTETQQRSTLRSQTRTHTHTEHRLTFQEDNGGILRSLICAHLQGAVHVAGRQRSKSTVITECAVTGYHHCRGGRRPHSKDPDNTLFGLVCPPLLLTLLPSACQQHAPMQLVVLSPATPTVPQKNNTNKRTPHTGGRCPPPTGGVLIHTKHACSHQQTPVSFHHIRAHTANKGEQIPQSPVLGNTSFGGSGDIGDVHFHHPSLLSRCGRNGKIGGK